MDELSWRFGKKKTSDVQKNVIQNGIGITNDKSLRRINEMMRNIFNGGNDNNRRNKKHHGHSHRKNNTKMQVKLSRRAGNQNRKKKSRRENPTDILKKSNRVMQDQVNALKSMLCKSDPSLCQMSDRSTRRVMNKITQDNITQIGDRNVNSQMSVIQNSGPSRYNRRHPSILDEYEEVIFLPNYQIVLK